MLIVHPVIVKRVLCDRRARLVDKLDERDTFPAGDHTDIVQVGIRFEQLLQILLCRRVWQVLDKENLVGREVLLGGLESGSFRTGSGWTCRGSWLHKETMYR